jgi:large subunit ribosomal protein L30
VGSIRITQTKSANGRLAKHKACLKGLGLRRIGHSVLVDDTAENRGMVNKVAYMLRIQEV